MADHYKTSQGEAAVFISFRGSEVLPFYSIEVFIFVFYSRTYFAFLFSFFFCYFSLVLHDMDRSNRNCQIIRFSTL